MGKIGLAIKGLSFVFLILTAYGLYLYFFEGVELSGWFPYAVLLYIIFGMMASVVMLRENQQK